ncbi:MAG: AAA family ATPase [bacterium]
MSTDYRGKISQNIDELQSRFFERDHIILSAWAALLSRNHMLQLGVPGTAKSMLTQAMCASISGSRYFERLLTKFSPPEELFGPTSMKGLENDEYRRIIAKMLPEAHIAFIDEIFKANASILNSLLTIINEREFDNGPDRIDVPLISMFGASNELPQEEELEALYDRFLLRFDVPYIQDGNNWEALMLMDNDDLEVENTITLEELQAAQADVRKVTLSPATVKTMREIKMRLERQGVIASDRRWKQTVRVLKAWAWLHGRDEVVTQDLSLLCDMMWRDPGQRPIVVQEVLAVTNPLDLAATEIYDTVNDVYSKWDPKDSASTEETAAKIRLAMEKLDHTIKTGKEEMLDKTREVRNIMAMWYKEVLKSMDL